MENETAILILAAGSSKRLGTPKQLLPYKEGTLLQDTISKLSDLQNQNIYVVLGAYYERIKTTIEHLPITIVKNSDWESGLGSSIAASISHIYRVKGIKKVLITLADLPLFETSNYQALLDTHLRNSLGITLTTYTNNSGVPVIFNSNYFESLKKLSGDEGAKSILIQNKNDVGHYKANIAYFDIDTMDDYLELIAP